MDRDEILRLKQITGLAALFRDVKFGQGMAAWGRMRFRPKRLPVVGKRIHLRK